MGVPASQGRQENHLHNPQQSGNDPPYDLKSWNLSHRRETPGGLGSHCHFYHSGDGTQSLPMSRCVSCVTAEITQLTELKEGRIAGSHSRGMVPCG